MDPEIVKIIDNNLLDKYYVEYGGFLSNHLSHGLIALHRLGASASYTSQFRDWYIQKLEKKDESAAQKQQQLPVPLTLTTPELSPEQLSNIRGSRVGYYVILEHFRFLLREKYGGSVFGLVQGELPWLLRGIAGSLLHGVIHLGYGFAAQSPLVVTEGLAYLHHSYLPLVTSDLSPDLQTLGKGSRDVMDVFRDVSRDVDLRSVMLYESKEPWVTRRGLGNFQNRMVALLTMRGDVIVQYAHQVEIPMMTLDTTLTPARLADAGKWLLDAAVALYQSAEKRNDFFLLHGVTSTWSLLQLLPALDTVDSTLRALQTHLAILLAVYVADDTPALPHDLLMSPDVNDVTWDDVRKKVLELKPETDEHIFKLVQVCYDVSRGIANVTNADMYKRACMTAITEQITF